MKVDESTIRRYEREDNEALGQRAIHAGGSGQALRGVAGDGKEALGAEEEAWAYRGTVVQLRKALQDRRSAVRNSRRR